MTVLGGFYMGRQGTPRDNNDGIVLALAPARSARGIREALISYPHFFFIPSFVFLSKQNHID